MQDHDSVLRRVEIRPARPDLVLDALAQNLGGMAAQIPDPGLSGPLNYFGGLAAWAGAATGVGRRAAAHVDDIDALQRRVRALGITSADGVGDTVEALAVAEAEGSSEAGELLVEALGLLELIESGRSGASNGEQVHPAEGPTVADLTAYLSARFGGDTRATAITVIPGGYSKTTLLVDATIEGERQEIVLRQVPAGHPDGALRPEYDVLEAVWRPDSLVPEPLWIEEDASALGGKFFASRRATGTPVGTVEGAGGKPVPEAVCRDIATFLAELHRQDPSQVASAPVLPMRTEEEVRAVIDDLVDRVTGSTGTTSPRLRAVIAWLRGNIPEPSRPCIVHGDAGFQNTLTDGNRMTAALDWERAHIGNAAEDLAYVRPSIEQVYSWDAFLQQYEAAGGEAPSAEALGFYTVFQDVWRHVECVRLAEAFYTTRAFSSAIAGFVLAPQFLASALRGAYGEHTATEAEVPA